MHDDDAVVLVGRAGWEERSDTLNTGADHDGYRILHPRHVFVTSRRLVEAFAAMRLAAVAVRKARDLHSAERCPHECITIVLDPSGFLTRLGTDHICGLRQSSTAGFHPSGMSRREMGFDRN